jgi:hypothetical protein
VSASHAIFSGSARGLRRLAAGVLVLSGALMSVDSLASATPVNHSYFVGSSGDSVTAVSLGTCTLSTNTACTLRDAATWASADGAGTIDNIYFTHFSSATTFALDQHTPITLSDAGTLTIVGAGVSMTTISGVHLTSVFINSGAATTISNLTIAHGSRGFNGNGGAITNNGTLTLNKVNFYENFAGGYGGAVVTTSHLTVHGGVWSRNTADNNCGGALDVFAGSATVDSVTMSDNVSDCGGAIDLHVPAAQLTLSASTLNANLARDYGDGGAILSNGSLTLTNDTITGNSATQYGGGLANDNSSATATLLNDTITNNSAVMAGGGIYQTDQGSGVLNIRGSILTGNVNAGIASQCMGYGPINSQGYNIVGFEGDQSCQFVGIGDKVDSSAHLLPLANYGGPVATEALAFPSAAILAEPAAHCPASDARGNARPTNIGTAACDAGSFELTPYSHSVSCGVLSGSTYSSITLSSCTPTLRTNTSATAPGSFVTTGGSLTWHPSSKTTTTAIHVSSPGRGQCAKGSVELVLLGVVNGGSSAYGGYFDKVSATLCQVPGSGKVTLLSSTRFLL